MSEEGHTHDDVTGAEHPPHRHGRVHRGHSAASHHYDLPDLPTKVDIFDTILRDGTQQEGLSLTVEDKIKVAEQLDHLGVAYIEGGWPGANPKDTEFFRRFASELRFETSTLVAFGSTRRAGAVTESDETLCALIEADTEVVCIVAKSWDRHVDVALKTSLDEAVAMVADSVAFLTANDKRVFLDAEHFFDGFHHNPEFALQILGAAEQAGAECLVLCDTNGGSLPGDITGAITQVRRSITETSLGIHCHNDAGVAVANSLAAVSAGVTQVQGCINGYGERSGNTDLATAIPDLSLKLNIRTIPTDRLERLTPVSHHIAEVVNMAQSSQQPYVGAAAFAHKAGLHASAVAKSPDLYEHIDSALVGNSTRVVVSEMAGRSTLAIKAAELGIELSADQIALVLDQLKRLEHEGYHFEVADGSLELLLRRAGGWEHELFEVESYRVSTELHHGEDAAVTIATVTVVVDGDRLVATAEGNGPVNALDGALRQCLGTRFPALASIHLTDYRVRVLDTGTGTKAVTRVLVDSVDEERSWTTIGVSENIIEASWQALYDSIIVGLLHAPS
jgi:2-isopropylmalate synthase